MEPAVTLAVHTNTLLARPDCLKTICSHVASGGTLIELCEQWKIRYGDALAWVWAEPERQRLFEAALVARDEWEREVVRRELRRIATVDMRRVFDTKGRLLPVEQWPAEVAAAMAGVDVTTAVDKDGVTTTTTKMKLWDKVRSLELAGKRLRMFVDRHEVDGRLTLEDIVVGPTGTGEPGT